MYLRGIQFSEIESILQFIYLGEATFYEERMDEFLAVAKSLEIKELCSAETERNEELDGEKVQSNPVTLTDVVEKGQSVTSDVFKRHADEFLAVAKSLEIKQLCNAKTERNEELNEEKAQSNPVTVSTDKVEKGQSVTSDVFKSHAQQGRRRKVVALNGRYECELCQKTFTKQ